MGYINVSKSFEPLFNISPSTTVQTINTIYNIYHGDRMEPPFKLNLLDDSSGFLSL